MRHLNSGRKLNRNSSHRKAMFKNMSVSIIKLELIKTTVPKAKELRRYIEPLITLAKIDSVHNRRLAFAKLRDNEAVAKLFTELGVRFKSRNGGYLRILKAGNRAGDNSPVAYIELLERVIVNPKDKEASDVNTEDSVSLEDKTNEESDSEKTKISKEKKNS